MRAWSVRRPGSDEQPPVGRPWNSRVPCPAPARCCSASRCAGCAERTCTSPKAIWRRGGRRRARPRGGRVRRGARGGRRRFAGGRAGRHRLAADDVRHVPVVPAGRGEPVRRPALHGLGRRRRLRRVRRRRRGFAYALPDAFDDEHAPRCCAPASSATARWERAELPARRPAGHLRLRRLGAPRRASGAPPARRCTSSPAAAARELARELGAARWAAAADAPPEPLDAAILFAPAGGLVPVALAASGSWRNARDRGDPSQRHPAPRLPGASVPGAAAAERDRQHAGRRRGVPGPRRSSRVRVTTSPYELGAADRALEDLAADRVTGAAVLVT